MIRRICFSLAAALVAVVIVYLILPDDTRIETATQIMYASFFLTAMIIWIYLTFFRNKKHR